MSLQTNKNVNIINQINKYQSIFIKKGSDFYDGAAYGLQIAIDIVLKDRKMEKEMNLIEILESVKNACHLQRRIGCNSKCPFFILSQSDCCALSNSNPRYWNVKEMANRFELAKDAEEFTDDDLKKRLGLKV